MSVQPDYNDRLSRAYPGQVAEGQFNDIVSLVLESAEVSFGKAVSFGVADDGCIAGGTAFRGISVLDKAQYNQGQTVGSNATSDKYSQNENVGAIRKGSVWVEVMAAVSPNDNVTFAANGDITNATGDGFTAIPNAKFETTAAANGIARVYLG